MFEPRVTLWLATASVAIVMSSCADDPMLYPDGPECRMVINPVPTPPTAPGNVYVSGTMIITDAEGFRNFEWDVTGPIGEDIEFMPQEGVGDEGITFFAETPGQYQIVLDGNLDQLGCQRNTLAVEVLDPTASSERFRLRFLPAAGQDAPAQERVFQINGGVDNNLQVLSLTEGREEFGSITDETGAAIPAYIRATIASAGPYGFAIERFADGDGDFMIRVEDRRYDYLVIPQDNAIAPQRFFDVSADELDLKVSPGLPVTGSVMDCTGAPIGDARVSLRVDDVPSTLATTDGAGTFALSARSGSPASVSIVAPVDSGLPELSLATVAGLNLSDSSSPFSVTYSDTAIGRTVDITAAGEDGTTPASGTRATFVARPISGAGTLTTGLAGTYELTGNARISVTADSSGTLSAHLPEAEYDVILEPANPAHGAVSLRYADLRPGQPTPDSLMLRAPATLTGLVRQGIGPVLRYARVSATPAGALARAYWATTSTASDSKGIFAMDLVAGASYQVQVGSLGAEHLHGWRSVDLPDNGAPLDVGTIQLARDVRVSGQVAIPTVIGPASGVTVRVLCEECPEDERGTPLAETITNEFGEFSVPVPDPNW